MQVGVRDDDYDDGSYRYYDDGIYHDYDDVSRVWWWLLGMMMSTMMINMMMLMMIMVIMEEEDVHVGATDALSWELMLTTQ